MGALALTGLMLLAASAKADTVLFSESFDGSGLPSSMTYTTDSFFTWKIDGSHRLYGDRTALLRGVALARSVPSFSLPASGILYSGDMGIPSTAHAGSYNVGFVFGNYIFLVHPGYPDGAFRLEEIRAFPIYPREPALIDNTSIGYTPAMGTLQHIEAFVRPLGSSLAIEITISGMGTDALWHTFSFGYIDPTPAFGDGRIGGAVRGRGFVLDSDGFFDNFEVRVPEPSTLALLAAAIGVAGIARRRRRKAA